MDRELTDEERRALERGQAWVCWLIIAVSALYFGAVVLAHWWPDLRAVLVAVQPGM